MNRLTPQGLLSFALLFSIAQNATVWAQSIAGSGELEEITFVEFSPDGNNLATITRNGTLKLLRASPFSETDARLIPRH